MLLTPRGHGGTKRMLRKVIHAEGDTSPPAGGYEAVGSKVVGSGEAGDGRSKVTSEGGEFILCLRGDGQGVFLDTSRHASIWTLEKQPERESSRQCVEDQPAE